MMSSKDVQLFEEHLPLRCSGQTLYYTMKTVGENQEWFQGLILLNLRAHSDIWTQILKPRQLLSTLLVVHVQVRQCGTLGSCFFDILENKKGAGKTKSTKIQVLAYEISKTVAFDRKFTSSETRVSWDLTCQWCNKSDANKILSLTHAHRGTSANFNKIVKILIDWVVQGPPHDFMLGV